MEPQIQQINTVIQKPKNKIWGIIWDFILTIFYLIILYLLIPKFSGCARGFLPCTVTGVTSDIASFLATFSFATFILLSRILRNRKKIFGWVLFLLSIFIFYFTFKLNPHDLSVYNGIFTYQFIVTTVVGLVFIFSKNNYISTKKRILLQVLIIIAFILNTFFGPSSFVETCGISGCKNNQIAPCPPSYIWNVNTKKCE